jgi:hypothetical protein
MFSNGQAAGQQSELQRKTLQNFNNRSNKSLNPSPVTAPGQTSLYGIEETSGTGGFKKSNKNIATPPI